MTLSRRFTYRQGNSNKFWEIAKVKGPTKPLATTWNVVTRWGRIGTAGQTQIKPFNTEWSAASFMGDKIREKEKKGYQEEDDASDNWLSFIPIAEGISVNESRVEHTYKESKDIKFPAYWKKIKKELLPGELAIYEKYDDSRTKERRNVVAKYYKILFINTDDNQELQEVYKSAWTMMRFISLKYLVSTSPYKPAARDAGSATVSELQKALASIPSDHKMVIDKGLKEVTNGKTKVLSLKQSKQGVDEFLEILTQQVKERQKIGPGGVSRKRARMLARKMRKR
jgi:predicted DNA-binding WGR domain protein